MGPSTIIAAFAAVWIPVAAAMGALDIPENVLPPEEIVRTVETELFADDGVDAHLIDVSVRDGIITLSGIVDNLLAKRRATRRAQRVKGVRGVVNRILVKPYPPPDPDLAAAIETALEEDPAADAYEIAVEAEDGMVTLTGTVDSRGERELAAIVASSVRGVRKLENAIEVHPPIRREDRELRAEIEQRLRWDMYVDDGLIAVEVDNARVTLDGIVGSAAEKQRAVSDAYVDGVSYVDADRLEVALWVRDDRLRKDKYSFTTNEGIASAIRDALRYDPRVSEFQLSVSVQHRTAILTGVVDNLRARKAAVETASSVVGVWRVKDYLRVRPKSLPSDETIRSKVERKIFYDPIISDQTITVMVRNAKVSLYGTVPTLFRKGWTEDLAASVKGVVSIANHLRVSPPKTLVTKPDWEIKEDIESEISWSPFVDSDEVTVAVNSGVASLRGVVDTRQERQAAEAAALTGGAVAVDNELKVRHDPIM
jgi:osmotically-inducible protein OsmY